MSLNKKILYRSVIAVGFIGLIFYIGFVPATYHYEITVPYTMLKTGDQFSNKSNLVKWYLPFSTNASLKRSIHENKEKNIESGDYSVSIADRSSVNVIINASCKSYTRQFMFSALSNSGDMESCNVKLTYKSTLFNTWTDKGGLIKNARRSLDNLKTYMEDTRQFYGYEIEQTTVVDTAFIFISSIVPVTEKRESTKKLFKKLIDYSESKIAGYNGTRIFYSTPYGNDKVMLFVSIGVSNRVNTRPEEEIQYKKMPFGKNLLVATYQGPYKDVSKVYLAMENFKADHKLSSMAIPYQKFLNDGYDFSDDQIVQMKVYYPIF